MAQILALDSVLMLSKLQTAGETFTTCLWHTDEPGDTLLLNYSIPTPQPLLLLLLHHSSSPPSLLFFSAPLAAVLPFLPLSLQCGSLRFIKSRRDPCIRPTPTHVNQAHLLHSNRISAIHGLLLSHSSPSPYRVTCLLVKQTPPNTRPHPFSYLGVTNDSLSSHSICGRLPLQHTCGIHTRSPTLPVISPLAVSTVRSAPLQRFMKSKHSKTERR